jgi:hypothetical protein
VLESGQASQLIEGAMGIDTSSKDVISSFRLDRFSGTVCVGRGPVAAHA